LAIPLHSLIRRNVRSVLNKLLLKLVNKKVDFSKLDRSKINRILLVRLNYRIGNIIFMTPLIRSIEKYMPHIKIDMLVGASFTKPIIKDMPNIQNVYDLPRELLKSPLKLKKFVDMVNRNNYDLVISPISGSVSSNIAILLLKAPIKLGIYEENTYSPLNRFVLPQRRYTHSALQPLAIMDSFFNDTTNKQYIEYLDIALSEDEKKSGQDMLNRVLEDNKVDKNKDTKIVGIFRDARNDKKIEDNWWIDYIKTIQKDDKDIIFIDILNPNETKPLVDGMLFFKEKNLRVLGQFFSSLDRFICADTGPMHLASGSLVPVIALFNSTNPSMYGPLGVKDKVIVINDKTIEEVANDTLKIVRDIS